MQVDTQIMLQHLPTGWSLYDGGNVLHRYGECAINLGEAATKVQAHTKAHGYWRETRWRQGPNDSRLCTQYVWVAVT